MNSILNQIKNDLETLGAFKNVKIGIEKGISAKDVPFARIVPTSHKGNHLESNLDFYIYVGIKKDSDAESSTFEIINLSNEVIGLFNYTELNNGLLKVNEMTFDEDRLDNFKMSAMKFSLEGYHD